jgi:DNA polymerase III epsilon subunit-like protein
MNYVFFDIECANCLNGEGKMCSFGYVLTDESFHVLKKKDILMNPNAEFLLGNSRTGAGIHLAYPIFKFQRQHTFPHYYKEICQLLEDKNNIAFGFAVGQDVSYLSYSCKRYGLPLIEFQFFDIQKFEKLIHKKKNPSGLDSLIEEYQLTSYTYHRSDDDALMTMEVFREILLQNQTDVSSVLKEYSFAMDNTSHFLEELSIRKKQKLIKKQHTEKIHQFFDEPHQAFNINLYNPNLYKKVFYFEYPLLYEEIDYFLKNKSNMESHGMIFTRNPEQANVAIIRGGTKNPELPKMDEQVIHMEFETLKKELSKKGN